MVDESLVLKMKMKIEAVLWFLSFLWFSCASNGLLSPKGVNFEGKNKLSSLKLVKNGVCIWVFFLFSFLVFDIRRTTVQALMGIKAFLVDPHGILENWDGDAVDPCSWTMVTCSAESLVIGL